MSGADIRHRLLNGVSTIALVGGGTALLASEAHADTASFLSGYWISTEGKYLFADGTGQRVLAPGSGGLATLPGQSDHVRAAYSYEIAVGGPLPMVVGLPGWDFRLAYTGIRSEHHGKTARGAFATASTSPFGHFTSTTQSVGFSSSIDQGFDIGDFDIGHDVGFGPVDGRLSFGARFVSFNQRTTGVLTLGGEGGSAHSVEQACSHFFGGGPRVGYDGAYRLGALGPVGVSLTGTVATAAIFGSGYHKATVSGTLGNTTEGRDETGLTPVVNADASLGVAFALPVYGSEAKLTIGYGGQAWINIMDTVVTNAALAGTSAGTRRGDQFFHGPFINIGMKW